MKWYLLITICLLATRAEASNPQSEKNDLQLIMAELMKNTQTLSHAILIQDYNQMEIAAAKIANHPKPSKQTRQTIKGHLMQEMSSFKQYDNTVHQAAMKMVGYAKSNSIQQITAEYLRMYQGCQSCHLDYKDRVSSLLNGK